MNDIGTEVKVTAVYCHKCDNKGYSHHRCNMYFFFVSHVPNYYNKYANEVIDSYNSCSILPVILLMLRLSSLQMGVQFPVKEAAVVFSRAELIKK